MKTEFETAKELWKETNRLDKLIHKRLHCHCPKCKKKMNTYQDVIQHVNKTKHYGDYCEDFSINERMKYDNIEYDIYKNKINQHLQTCERWLEFLLSERNFVWTIQTIKQSIKCEFGKEQMDNKIKDLDQAIKYHKSKLGEQEK